MKMGLVILLVIAFSVPSVPIKYNIDNKLGDSIEYVVNPLYHDTVNKEDLGVPDTQMFHFSENVNVYTTISEAAKGLHEQIRGRTDESNTFSIRVSQDIYGSQTFSCIWREVLKYEDDIDGTMGDYFDHSIAGYSIRETSHALLGYVQIDCAVTFYLSAVQQSELNEAIDEKIRELGLDCSTYSDYEKIRDRKSVV